MKPATETISMYLPIRKQVSKEDFARRYPTPFLVQEVNPQSEEEDKEFEFSTIHITKDELRSVIGGRGNLASAPVYRLAKRATNLFEGMINVGRAANNDVVLDFQAISKFHAYFTKDPASNTFYLTDADSTNGSFINGLRLRPHQKYVLGETDKVSFAQQVDLKYYTSGAFYDMLGTVVA
jgi:hypothetical protein